MVWIAGTTIGSTTGSYVFSSIPQTFTHLQVRMFVKGSGTGTRIVAFAIPNNDLTTSLYAQHYLTGDGASATSGNSINTSQFSAWTLPASGSGIASQVYGSAIIDILDYTNTNKYKTQRSLSGFDANGLGNVSLTSQLYMSTNAITSLGIYVENSIVAGSRFDLYGITTSSVTGA